MRRSHDLVGRIVEQSATFSFFFSISWILFTLSAVLITVWPAGVAKLSVQRVVLKLVFGEIEKIPWNRCNSVI